LVELSHEFATDDDGPPLTPDAVTVAVVRDGRSVAAVTGPAVRAGSVYTFSAGELGEGVYTVSWDGGPGARDRTVVEVCGAHLFSVADVRQVDEELSAVRFPAATVRAARERVEAEFEQITGRSFVPRLRRIAAVSTGPADPYLIPVPDVITVGAVTGSDDEPVSVGVERIGTAAVLWDLPPGEFAVEVRYGFIAAPVDVQAAGLLRVRTLLFEPASGIPDRATSFQPAEGGTYTLSTPGVRGAQTGIPDVDAVLARYTIEEFGVWL
jgi:hypothetical protein